MFPNMVTLAAATTHSHGNFAKYSSNREDHTMFVHDIETFSVLHDYWLTILSHPFDFSTTRCTFLSSIRISTFLYRRCVVFAVGGDPILRVQKYHDIETVVTLGHNGFG